MFEATREAHASKNVLLRCLETYTLPQSHFKSLFCFYIWSHSQVSCTQWEKGCTTPPITTEKGQSNLEMLATRTTKHQRRMRKKLYGKLSEELNKRKLNTDAITQILELTFKKRRAVIKAITDTDITKTVLQKFPFLDNGTTVSNTYKTKKLEVLSSVHYFMSCSLVNASVEPFVACRVH